MIPLAYITEWKEHAPWQSDAQVEQDLVLSRALIEIYSNPLLKKELAFRGGTALNKIFFKSQARYSEDIDLVRTNTGPAKLIMDTLRNQLDSWLGKPTTKQNKGRITFVYRFESESIPVVPLRLKVEINTREHKNILDYQLVNFKIKSRWFSGSADLLTYRLEELVATKLRALYQRKKGRDLFDLAKILDSFKKIETDKVIRCFQTYVKDEGNIVTRAQFESNLSDKLNDAAFLDDIQPLLVNGIDFDAKQAMQKIHKVFVSKIPGEAWKGKLKF